MSIHILHDQVTPEQVSDMLQRLETYIKLAVDIERHVIAGGGRMHAEAEEKLLQDGSRQEDIWGADWNPNDRTVTFEALINIRPHQNNRSMVIQDAEICNRVEAIVRWIFEGVK
ncbi:MAG: DUF5674 family protein [Anaerolineales bacterium]|nr:DUF5674 family protein [Anaerolineales bacterium]